METTDYHAVAATVATTLEEEEIAGSLHGNADLAPTAKSQRRWGLKDIAALWVSMSACIPTYMLASSLIAEGMNWWQAVLTIFLGNTIVLVPMVLNAHAGTKYGIPFPIYCRSSFGILGANVPALLRAFVACGWFGIQAWIGGWAIYKILAIYIPAWERLPMIPWLDINLAQIACFLAFWAVNMVVIYLGIDSIRFLLNIKAPILLALGLALLAWAYSRGARIRPDAGAAVAVRPGRAEGRPVLEFLLPGLDRDDRVLGHALAQYPGFHPVCAVAARPGTWPGAGSAADDGPLFVHRRGRHLGDDHDLREVDLGPGRVAFPIP